MISRFYIVFSLFLLVSIEAHAARIGPYNWKMGDSPKEIASRVEKTPGLSMQILEMSDKDAIIRDMAKFGILKYLAMHQNPNNQDKDRDYLYEQSDSHQSWVLEVQEAIKTKKIPKDIKPFGAYKKYMQGAPIDIAKKVAMFRLLMEIQKRWNVLDPRDPKKGAGLWQSTINENADPAFSTAKALIMDRINNELTYSIKKHIHGDAFLFELPRYNAFITVDKKTLSSGVFGIDVDSRNSSNRVEDSVIDLCADNDEECLNKKRRGALSS